MTSSLVQLIVPDHLIDVSDTKTAVMRVHVTPEDQSNFKLGFDRVRWASSS